MDHHDEPAVTAAMIIEHIETKFDQVDVVTAESVTFFSLDPETYWPNFATIMTSDEYDDASDLSRPGVYRLNIGIGRASFDAIAGPDGAEHDHSALDIVMPHPVYARQRWVCVLNPSPTTFETRVKPLLEEAYAIIARRRPADGGG